jgi:peptide/nickel transport system permease protein
MKALRHPALVIGLILTIALLAAGSLSLVWTPYNPLLMSIGERLKAPSAHHWLGTDQFGRDVGSMLMRGAANSLYVGILSVGGGVLGGAALGTFAAAVRGSIVDEAVMRSADFTFAFPVILTAIMITQLLGPGTIDAVIAIVIFNIPVFARLTRSAALSVWSLDFVTAARAAGKTPFEITVEHVIPNIAGLIVVQATIQFALAILAEAGLSYLGVGTQPPNPSWGRMLNDAQTYLRVQPLLAIFPGAAIALAVFGFNMLGDGLRDLVDPKSRRARN